MKTTAVFALLLLVCHVSAYSVTEDMITLMARTLDEQQAEIAELKKLHIVPKVAFSASLVTGAEEIFGPSPTHPTTLIFKNVLTNLGNAYSPNTGIFTAPVKGAYQFLWSVGGRGGSEPIAAGLIKNSEITFKAYERNAAGYMSASQALTLTLEAGDVVFLRLWPGYKVYDDGDRVTTFSGHLLYTM